MQIHYPVSDHRGHLITQMGASMRYPSYLEHGPNYEEEMRYYHGDTLSPKDKVKHIVLMKSMRETLVNGLCTRCLLYSQRLCYIVITPTVL